MAVKSYAKHNEQKNCAVFSYKDEETGEEENIVFKVSPNLFPLFLSYADMELMDAMDEYEENLKKLLPELTGNAFEEYIEATPERREELIRDNPMLFTQISLHSAQLGILSNGVSLLVALAVTMHANAYAEGIDQSTALALGEDSLPDEVFNDVEFLTSLFTKAFNFASDSKKK